MSSLNLSKFKKLKSTKTHDIYESPEGHQMHIAKNEMKEDTDVNPGQKAIDKTKNSNKKLEVAHYAHGTKEVIEAEPDTLAPGDSDVIETPMPKAEEKAHANVEDPKQFLQQAQLGPYNPNTANQSVMPPTITGGEDNGLTPPSAALNAGQAQAPAQIPSGLPGYQQGAADYRAGVQEVGQAQAGMAEAEGRAASRGAQLDQQQIDEREEDRANYLSERQGLINDINKGAVNPNHYLSNLNVGGSILTGLGIILGGAGGGITGQGNPAMDFINRQIDRDIEAQKVNLGRKENLLHANLQHFRNLNDASQMTAIQTRDMISHQALSMAAKSKSALAMANAKALVGQFDMQNSQTIAQMEARKAALNGGFGGTDPEKTVPYLVPPEHQKQVYDELGKSKYATEKEAQLMQWWDQGEKENTLLGRVGRLGYEPPSIAALANGVLPLIKDQEGRVNQFEHDSVKGLFPGPGTLKGTSAERRQAFQQFVRGKQVAPTATAYGVPLHKRLPETKGFKR